MKLRAACQAIVGTIIVTMLIGVGQALAAPKCPIDLGAQADNKLNKLYLFFPSVDVPNDVDKSVFPPHGFNPKTEWLPLPKFDKSALKTFKGTEEELRDAIHDVVADIYCEFNVQVITTTEPPPTTAARRNVVGMGTDHPRVCDEILYGEATTAGGDPGDSKTVDFARIFAGAYNCSGLDLALSGWANSIGGTAAHEAAHNYGLSHEDGNETESKLHLMRRGRFYDAEDRAKPRYFSNFETSLLARNIGLSIDTMWTWEFTNPNTQPAATLRMELLSVRKDLTMSWAFAKETSPWVDPVFSGPLDKRVFRGREYNVYRIEWSAGNPQWAGGAPGQVPQGKTFQVGATFSSLQNDIPDNVIISGLTLFDANGQALQRQPPWMGFDAGVFESRSQDLNVRFFNLLDRRLTLRGMMVRDLPRVMSINAMMRDKPISDVLDRPFLPWEWGVRGPLPASTVLPDGIADMPVANRRQGRHISVQRGIDSCMPEEGSSGLNCHAGLTADDLFPATTMYITATIVDADGLESQLYYQVAGRRARLPCGGSGPC
jgi:hypothetical protein